MIKHCVLYSGGFMKRRIFCFILFLFIFISLLFVKSFKKEEIDYSVSPVKKNNNTLSMMLENDDGVYEYTTSDSWPQKGYSFNAKLSKCENGGELSWDDTNKSVVMTGNTSDKCYIYFDIAKPKPKIIGISNIYGDNGNIIAEEIPPELLSYMEEVLPEKKKDNTENVLDTIINVEKFS